MYMYKNEHSSLADDLQNVYVFTRCGFYSSTHTHLFPHTTQIRLVRKDKHEYRTFGHFEIGLTLADTTRRER